MEKGVLLHWLQDRGSTTPLNWVFLSRNQGLTSTSTPDWLASAAQRLPLFLVASGSLLAWAQWGLCPYSLSEGRISESGTIFLEVHGSGPREILFKMQPTPRGWIEHPVSLGLGKRMGGCHKARLREPAKGENPAKTPAQSWSQRAEA